MVLLYFVGNNHQKLLEYRSVFKLIVSMSFMVVVAIQHRIVNQLHLIFLNSITLFLLLFCNLSLAKGWRVWPLDLVHKIMHKFLTKAIQ